MNALSRGWRAFLLASLVAGVLLRCLYVEDMEWKEDEQINYKLTQAAPGAPFPLVGMNSGVYLANPGMSVWVFMALGRIAAVFGGHSPTAIARGLQLVAIAGIALTIPLAFRFVAERDRKPWLWAFALAMVNPFQILYQRKLWPQGFLPLFTTTFLMGWFRRDRLGWAIVWGLVGALVGQIHMSGFFFAAAFAIGAWLGRARARPHWGGWLAGSIMGALPLVPWAMHALQQRTGGPVVGGGGVTGWLEAVAQLKFWVFWVTDILGLHLGNPLGLLKGGSFAQIADFARYPVLGGHATGLVGVAHLGLAVIGVAVLGRALGAWARQRPETSESARAQWIAWTGFGALMTATGVNIRRYYTMILTPLEFAWFSRLALGLPRGRQALALLWLLECFVSAAFVGYIHVHEGARDGDYGVAYRTQPHVPETPNAPEGYRAARTSQPTPGAPE